MFIFWCHTASHGLAGALLCIIIVNDVDDGGTPARSEATEHTELSSHWQLDAQPGSNTL